MGFEQLGESKKIKAKGRAIKPDEKKGKGKKKLLRQSNQKKEFCVRTSGSR